MALIQTARIQLHEVLIRGRAATTTLAAYADGVQFVPVSATFKLEKPDGTAQIDTVAATVSGSGTMAYDIPAGQLPVSTTTLSDGYQILWSAIDTDGGEFTFRRPCAVTLSKLYPVITDLDLVANYSDIEAIRPSSLSSYQNFLDEAWITIIQRVRDQGNFEYLIMDPQSLRSVHLDLTFYLIFKDMDSSGLGDGTRYLELAKEHRFQFEAGWKRLKFRYDLDQDNTMDNDESRRPANPVIYTSRPPSVWIRRW